MINSPDLLAIARAEGVGDVEATVGIGGRAGPGPADRDIDGRGIDGIGADAFQMRHDPLAGRARRGVDGADPAMPDVSVGEPGHVECLPGAVVLLDGEAPMVAVDPDDLGGIAVVPVGGAIALAEGDDGAGMELAAWVASALVSPHGSRTVAAIASAPGVPSRTRAAWMASVRSWRPWRVGSRTSVFADRRGRARRSLGR